MLNYRRQTPDQSGTRRRSVSWRRPLGCERLEDRRVLAVFVNGADLIPDGGGCGSFANPCNDIQTGVDTAPAGGEVYVAGGFYSENVTFAKDLRIRGEAGLVTINPPGPFDGIDITGSHRVVLEDLHVTGAEIGIFATGLISLELQNVEATANRLDGLTVTTASSVRVISGDYSDNLLNGITLTGVTSVDLLDSVSAESNSDHGVDIRSANRVQIAGGTFGTNDLDGIHIATSVGMSSALTIDGVTAGANLGDGLNVRAWTGDVSIGGSSFNGNFRNGLFLDDVGNVELNAITAGMNSLAGISVSGAAELLDTDGSYSENNDHGVELSDVAGNVTLHRTTANDNDRDFDFVGDGIVVYPDVTAIGAASLTLLGVAVADTDGSMAITNQVHGVRAQDVPGTTEVRDSFHAVFPVAATGNSADGLHLDGGGPVEIFGGVISANRSAGIRILGHTSAELTDVTASSNTLHGVTTFGSPNITVVGGTYNSNSLSGLNIESAANVSVQNGSGLTANSNAANGLNVMGSGMVSVRGGTFSMNAGRGLRLSGVGDLQLSESVTASSNLIGLHLTNVMGVSETDGVYTSNDDHGLLLENIGGHVFLRRTTANNNDRDVDGIGDGVHARSTMPGPPAIGGGGLHVFGGSYRDTDGALAAVHQQNGIFVTNTPMAFFVPDGNSNATVNASGNARDGVNIGGGTVATFVDGDYSSNRGDGIDLAGITGMVDVINLTANSNTRNGLGIAGGGTIRIGMSTFESNSRNGIELDMVGNIEVRDVQSRLNQFDGFNASVAFDVLIDGGDFSSNFDNGIETFTTGDVSVSDVVVDDSGSAVLPPSSGIKIHTAPTLAISGVTVTNSTLHGIQSDAVSTVTLTTSTDKDLDDVFVDSTKITHTRDGLAQDDFAYTGVTTLNVNTSDSDDMITIQFGSALPTIVVAGGEQGFSDMLTVIRDDPMDIVTVTATTISDGTSMVHYSEIEKVVVDSGDFNFDGDLDLPDIDALVAEIAAANHTPRFELTGDRLVNLDDLYQWLALAGAANLPSGNPYLLGDANLSGAVDGSDFNAWNANKFTSDNGWSGGDFNADGSTDGSDFSIWNTNKFQTSDASRAPELDGLSLRERVARQKGRAARITS